MELEGPGVKRKPGRPCKKKRLNNGDQVTYLAEKMRKLGCSYVKVEKINVERELKKVKEDVKQMDELVGQSERSEEQMLHVRNEELIVGIADTIDTSDGTEIELEVSGVKEVEYSNTIVNPPELIKDEDVQNNEATETNSSDLVPLSRITRAGKQKTNINTYSCLKRKKDGIDEEESSPEPSRRAPSSRISSMKASSCVTPTAEISPSKFVNVKTGKVFEKHPCPLCGKVFASAKGLQCHTLVSCGTLPNIGLEDNLVVTFDQYQCDQCGKEFSQQQYLKKHSQSATVHTRPYSCSLEICDRTFTRISHLYNHRKFHPDIRDLECDKCNMRFSHQDSLQTHQNLTNCGRKCKPSLEGEKQLQCDECPKTFSNSNYLSIHLNYHWDTTDRALLCTVGTCMERFSCRYKLERHMEEHYGIMKNGMLLCATNGCGEMFKDPVLLKDHLEQHIAVVICRACGLQFANKLDMLLHRSICLQDKNKEEEVFNCPVCSKKFKAKRFLDNHVKLCGQLIEEKLSKCDKCEQVFISKQLLMEHVRISHADYKSSKLVSVKGITRSCLPSISISCDFPGCEKVFSRYILLKNHLYSHTDNPYHCTQDCQLSFSQLSMYQDHCIAEHGGNFSFMNCDKCDQLFTVESHMENHREKFHEKSIDLAIFDDSQFYDRLSDETGPFLCKHSDCDASFLLRSQLRIHYMTHDPLATTCTLCQTKFSDLISLTHHRVSDHQLASPTLHCPFCQDSFLSPQYLRIHLLSDHPPPWFCQHTGCIFSPTFLLEASIHMESHLPITCDWPGCGKQIKTRDLLIEHFQVHTETLLSCPVQTCSFVSCMNTIFEKHIEQHQNEKLFSCQPCNYHSFNMRQLECHLDSGHKQRPRPHEFTSEVNLPCKMEGCSASFTQEIWLLKHEKNVHVKAEVVNVSSKDMSESVEIETETEVDITFVSEPENGGGDNEKKVLTLEIDTENNLPDAHLNLPGEAEDPFQSTSLSPQLDNSLVQSLSLDRIPEPPLASSPLKDKQEESEGVPDVVADKVEMLQFTESSVDSIISVVPPLEIKDSETSKINQSQDEYNVEKDVENNFDTNSDKLENMDETIVDESTDFVEVIEPVINSLNLSSTGIAIVSDESKEGGANEDVKTEPIDVKEESLMNHELRKSSLHTLYSSVVTAGSQCPSPGQFTRLFAIDQNMLENTVVPELLEPVDESSICKGLAIDLLEMHQQCGVSQDLLAGYVKELLPVGVRPTELGSSQIQQMVARLVKMKVQASRFRARYRDFPMYLNKYLVELCNPFT